MDSIIISAIISSWFLMGTLLVQLCLKKIDKASKGIVYKNRLEIYFTVMISGMFGPFNLLALWYVSRTIKVFSG